MKTYDIKIKSAERWSMESDHFTLVSPRTGCTAYVRPHRKRTPSGTEITKEEHNEIVKIWSRCVTIVQTKTSNSIRLTSEQLHLVNKVKGY